MKAQLAWSYAAHGVSLILPPFTLILLARLLTPADFGVFAVVTIVVLGLQTVLLTPVTEVIVQSSNDNVAEYMLPVGLAIGLVLALISISTAPFLSSLLNMPEAASAIMISAVILLISPILETAIKLNIRAIDFRLVFVRRLVTPIGNAVVAIPLASAGAGYWALVYGQIAGLSMGLLFVLWFGSWRPRIHFDLQRARSDLRFSSQMIVQGTMQWIRSQSDKLFVAASAPPDTLGHFSLARQISGMAFAVIVDPVKTYAYSVMSRQHRSGEDVADFYCTAVRRILILTIPMAVVLFIHREVFIATVLGAHWLPLTEFFAIFVLSGWLSAAVALNMGVFKAMGRPGVMTVFMAVRGVATLIAFALAVSYGPMAIALAALGLAVIFSPINTWITLRIMQLSWGRYLRSVLGRPVLVTLPILFLAIWSDRTLDSPVELIAAIIGISCVTAAAFLLLERPFKSRTTHAT